MLIIEEKIKNQTYEISLKSNGVVVGEFVKVDGFYYYSQGKTKIGGLFSQEFLESLTNELKNLNKELNQSIDDYFKKNDTPNKTK